MKFVTLATTCAMVQAIVLPGLLCPDAWAKPSSAKYSDLTLTMASDACGQQTLQVSPAQMVLKAPNLKVMIVMAPPKWDVLAINDTNKTYCRMEPEQWNQSSEHASQNKEYRWIFRQGKSSTIAGLQATQWIGERFVRGLGDRPKGFKPSAETERKVFRVLKSGEKEPPKLTPGPNYVSEGIRREIWLTRDFALPDKAIIALARGCGLSAELGSPVRIIDVHKGGRKEIFLDTLKFQPGKWKAPSLAQLKSYKKVDSAIALSVGQESAEDLTSLFGEDEAPAKKKR